MHNFFLEGDTPAWFTLRFVDNPPRIVFGVEEKIFEWFMNSLPKNKYVPQGRDYVKSFGANRRFLRDLASPWGFGGSIVTSFSPVDGVVGRFLEHVVAIPRVVSGSNGGVKIDWKTLVSVSTSLAVISLSVFDSLDQEMVAKLPRRGTQLITLLTNFGRGNLMVHGSLSPRFSLWLESMEPSKMEIARQAMVSAYFHMNPSSKQYGDDHIRASMTVPGKFSLEVQNTSLWVAPKSDFGRGDTFSDSHTETHIEQLTLIAGLAALCGEAQKFLW